MSPFNQAMVYQICNLAQFANVKVVRVEKDFPKTIDRFIEVSLAPLRFRLIQCEASIVSHGVILDNLIAKLDAREKAEGSLDVLFSMRGELDTLRDDVDQLSSTDISML